MPNNDLTAAKARIKELEQQIKRYQEALMALQKALQSKQTRIRELGDLVKEVQDHVDPTKKDIQLAVRQAKSWVSRAVKILKKIF